jgi:hypothetical protein
MAEVVDISTFEPDDGDTCLRYRQQKIKGRWTHAACGSPAVTRIQFAVEQPRKIIKNSDGSIDYAPTPKSYPICLECLIFITKDLVSTLGYL